MATVNIFNYINIFKKKIQFFFIKDMFIIILKYTFKIIN